MAEATLTKKDFQTNQEVRWCPGCGDYAILSAVQSAFADLGLEPHNTVVVSGIGCASRFPYYMSTYGFHTVHGRAPALASGLKIANPDLSVWIVSGDGDAFSIGGNHVIHLMRRNINVNLLVFDNRIYGLTKGQYSPTSEIGKRTKSTPYGSLDRPFNPASVALGAGATFVARSIDVHSKHLKQTLIDANGHTGTSFVQIFQNCNIFNDGAFEQIREKKLRDDNVIELEHGKPLIFGKERNKGIRWAGPGIPEIVQLGAGVDEDKLVVHDERGTLGYLMTLAEMQPPAFPMPIGVLRRVEAPTVDAGIHAQIAELTAKKGVGKLQDILRSGNIWTVD